MSLLTGARSSSLGNSFRISLKVFKLFCYCHFVIRQDHGFSSSHEPHQLAAVAGLGLCLVAITRATVVVLCRGENGTAVLAKRKKKKITPDLRLFCLLSLQLEHKYSRGGSKFLFSYWLLNVNYGVCISTPFCLKLELCFLESIS